MWIKSTFKADFWELQRQNPDVPIWHISKLHAPDIFRKTPGILKTEAIKLNGYIYSKEHNDYTEIYEAHANKIIPFNMTDEELELYVDSLDWNEVILIALT